ncbi:MAG: phosphoribosylformylglycinamidine synthase subunit PurQ [Planctomycetota bacterium]
MAQIKVLILRAAGTNCDLETQHAWELAGAFAERVHIGRLREQPQRVHEYQVLTLPGGFSYGDDIAAGRILARQIQRSLLDDIRAFVDAGKLVLGICNGFQVLVQTGLLPGPLAPSTTAPRPATSRPSKPDSRACTITYNEPPGFQDRWVYLRATTDRCVFLERDRIYEMPIAHGEGRVLFADERFLQAVVESGQNALVYSGPNGGPSPHSPPSQGGVGGGSKRPGAVVSPCPRGRAEQGQHVDPYRPPNLHGEPTNPNGSQADIAGMCDATGRVLGLMPHPERFVTWTQHPCWTSLPPRPEGDGLALFRRAVAYFR